ncbi:MAG: hypothetical protein ACXVHI_05930 [Frankiaceae bacterium]
MPDEVGGRAIHGLHDRVLALPDHLLEGSERLESVVRGQPGRRGEVLVVRAERRKVLRRELLVER